MNVPSLAGLKGGLGMTAYSASKWAIIAFARALAVVLAPGNIRTDRLSPGWIDTSFNEPTIGFLGGYENHEALVQQAVPLQRQGRIEEIAPDILYLASDASSDTTGVESLIDGGIL